ncbi:MAG TPA: DegT/DnrJ/EryC1/StrS family aminotransferase [Pyrinomonadaceae bacterium]|jgi:dTDP-4-amino-4,6-dideoxygalactose transaminase
MIDVERETQPVPLLDLKAQYATIRDEIRAAIDRVADSQHFILGPEVEALEREVAAYSQCEFGIGVSSGTDGLLVALMAIDLKPGDEVITTPYTFFATASAVARLHAKPVFVDIDPLTYNIDPSRIEAAITERTRAIIPVHLYGQVADMTPVMEVARRHNLTVIEDAAQAIGSEDAGRRAGSIGDMAVFSFFPSKNLGGFGDGGMVTTNDAALAKQVKLLRNHGYAPKYYNKVIGGNFRLDAIQAAVLRIKLKYLDNWTEKRQQNAATYRRLFNEAELSIEPQLVGLTSDAQGGAEAVNQLNELSGVVLPFEAADVRHIYNQFVIRCGQRDALLAHLKQRKIGTEIYYPVPMHMQECFAELGHAAGDFPQSERAARETLALPIYPELTESMMGTVVEAIADFYRAGKN